MKVSELMEILSKYNPDSTIEVSYDSLNVLAGIVSVKVVRVFPQEPRYTDKIFETPTEDDSHLTLAIVTE